MIIEILICIIGFFAILSVEHFFLYIGFFSIWAFLLVYLYNKTNKPVTWGMLIVSGLALGVSFDLGLGTFLLSAGISIFFFFLVNKFIPDDHFLTKYIPYFLTFLIFYVLRKVFGSVSNTGAIPVIRWQDMSIFLICSAVSTILTVLIDRLYLQMRPERESSNRGMGIEIRRR